MNWSYVAGFFDGEGTVGFLPRKGHGFRTYVSMAQTDNDGHLVLKKIRSFLLSQGVKLSLYPVRRLKNTSVLCSYKHETVKHFLEFVLPLLIVKKVAALRALQEISDREWRVAATIEQRKKAAKLYLAGASMEEVKKRFGIGQEALHKGLSECGQRMRTRSESASLMWKCGRRKAA